MPVTNQPCDLTITEVSSAITEGKLSVLELVTSCLERIGLLEEKIKAWTLVDREGALEAAHRLDRELQQGRRRGPLHGIPVGIKDIFYTAGLRTEAGARSWAGFVPSYDAVTVARLKEAGAIILGKTQTTEFAYLDPPPTCNPWNAAHTPGGSSSGSGAGVAAGMCMAALGSQTIGSTLRPAAYNGIVGFKAEHGRISTYGVVPLSWNLDHVGILARNVEDAAFIFQAIAGYDSRDLHSLREQVPDCLNDLEKQKTPRLGLVRQYFYEHADEEMRQHTEEVAKRLRQAGAQVEETELPSSFAATQDTCETIMAVEAAACHQEMFAEHKDQYRSGIRALIEHGMAISSVEFAKALQQQLQQRADIAPLLRRVDALLTPGTTGAAPYGLTSTGSSVMQGPWSITGLPAISLPTGLNKDGLPLGVQLAGPPLAENHLFAVAKWCERTLNVHLRPPLNL
ncbi:amidase [Chloroflexota bacterium]